ncbi:MAG: S8 family serine peptidase, partial [Pseudomonadota bacterium]
NEIIVANMRSGDGFWNGSSLGPTRDGRIKPDVGAPGSYGGFPREATSLRLDIDKITVIADGVTREWTFNGTGTDWHEGWGNSPAGAWWSSNGMMSVSQQTEGSRTFMRMVIEPPPWGSAFTNRPFISLSTESDGTQLAIDGGNADFAIVEYRYETEPFWEDSVMSFAWFTDWTNTSVDWYSQGSAYGLTTANDTWQTLVIPLSDADDWSGEEIDYIHLRLSAPLQYTAQNPDVYGGSSGSSAAAPIVAGAVALLSEQMSDEFGVDLDSYDPSPFWLPAPGTGNPLPSTYKAIVVHNATDLIGTPEAGDPDNPDTGQATFYHAGPDYATGYGMLNVQAAVDFVQLEADNYGGTPLSIVENEISTGDGHQYDIIVPFGCQPPLKVTLAWDDFEGDPSSSQVTPKLINNLDLILQDPDGNLHFPWSLDLPYIPTSPAEYPSAVEPEPITAADIVPARRDQPNARDNVEQVLVDMPDYGVWKLWVLGSGMGTASQNYSLAIGRP